MLSLVSMFAADDCCLHGGRDKNERDWEWLLSAVTGNSERHPAPQVCHCSKQMRNAVLRLFSWTVFTSVWISLLPAVWNPADICDDISIWLPISTP